MKDPQPVDHDGKSEVFVDELPDVEPWSEWPEQVHCVDTRGERYVFATERAAAEFKLSFDSTPSREDRDYIGPMMLCEACID